MRLQAEMLGCRNKGPARVSISYCAYEYVSIVGVFPYNNKPFSYKTFAVKIQHILCAEKMIRYHLRTKTKRRAVFFRIVDILDTPTLFDDLLDVLLLTAPLQLLTRSIRPYRSR